MRLATVLLFTLGISGAEEAKIVNPSDGKWDKSKNSESVTLREGPSGTELLARYPGGHEFVPHWHNSNERIVLIEGKLRIKAAAAEKELEPGGYAFLPAKEVQQMKCVSESRCSFYVFWDGKLDFNRASK